MVYASLPELVLPEWSSLTCDAFLPGGSTVLCQRQIEQSDTATAHGLPTFQKKRAQEEELVYKARRRRRYRFGTNDLKKQRSATSCVDPARFQSLRTRSRKVMEIFSWCIILKFFKNIFQCVAEKCKFGSFPGFVRRRGLEK